MERRQYYAFRTFPIDMAAINATSKLIDQNFSQTLMFFVRLGVKKAKEDNLNVTDTRKLFFELAAEAAAKQSQIDDDEPESPYSNYSFLKKDE
jgi:hypothetical protein